jgi:NADPH:quinone reductase-like Zn-dependent oxidoreductase
MTEKMNAWVPDGKGSVAFKEVPVPVPAPDQALIKCSSTTISRGEVRHLPHTPPGRILGLDLAGVVLQQAADGSGPPAGARVIAMTGHSGGGWGQKAVLPATTLGVIPDALSWAEAAVLPNPGLTAFYAIRHAGLLVGKRVLVTGVTGGVARIAVQLAQLGGAEVMGTVSRPERVDAVKSLNLAQVAVGNNVQGPFDLIVDTVGGSVLSRALEVVGPEGVVVTMGGGDGFDAPSEQAIVPHGWFFRHPGARLQAENVGLHVIRRTGVSQNLELLAKLVANKRIKLDVEQEVNWRDAARFVNELQAGAPASRIALMID